MIDRIEILELENGWVVNHGRRSFIFKDRKAVLRYLDASLEI